MAGPASDRCRSYTTTWGAIFRADGNTRTEAIRALKRRLSDVVFRALVADATALPMEVTLAVD